MDKAKRILLTDDDRDDQELFTEALNSIDPGIVCYCAEHGKHALKLLLSNEIDKPNIIFIDINMPVMDGWALLKALKKDNSLNDIPVIIYSTSSELRDKKIAMDLGALYFITKPDNFKSLKSILEIIINNLNKQSLVTIGDDIEEALKNQ